MYEPNSGRSSRWRRRDRAQRRHRGRRPVAVPARRHPMRATVVIGVRAQYPARARRNGSAHHHHPDNDAIATTTRVSATEHKPSRRCRRLIFAVRSSARETNWAASAASCSSLGARGMALFCTGPLLLRSGVWIKASGWCYQHHPGPLLHLVYRHRPSDVTEGGRRPPSNAHE